MWLNVLPYRRIPFFFVLFVWSSLGFAAPRNLIVPVEINTLNKGEMFIRMLDDDILIRLADLTAAGIIDIKGIQHTLNGELFVSLNSLKPDFDSIFSDEDFTLKLTVSSNHFSSSSLDLQDDNTPKNIRYISDFSTYLNYAVNWPGTTQISANGDFVLAYKTMSLNNNFFVSVDNGFVRGLNYFQYDEPKKMRRFIAGDSIAVTTALGGGSMLAGFHLLRGFDLNPYFIRFPGIQNLAGAVLTPSTADIYVNGVLTRSEAIAPGPFELKNIRVPAGAGNVQIVVRDAYGNQTSTQMPYYVPLGILSEGISDYRLSIGLPRINSSAESFNYELLPQVLGVYRRGITRFFTVGGHLEAAHDLIDGSIITNFGLPFGDLEISGAASGMHSLIGYGGVLAYAYTGRFIGAGGSSRVLSKNFANISLDAKAQRPFSDSNVFMSVPLGLGFVAQVQAGAQLTQNLPASYSTTLNLSGTLFKLFNFSISGTRRVQDNNPALWNVFATISLNLGEITNLSSTVSYDDNKIAGGVQLQRSLPLGEGYGYRLESNVSEESELGRVFAQYQSPYGRYDVTYARDNQLNTYGANVSGGVVFAAKRLFFTRPIQGGFGVVHVANAKNVRAYVNNQQIGRTDSQGYLLLPNLIPYYANIVRIEDKDLPLNFQIGETEYAIAPPFNGGGLIEFQAMKVQSILGKVELIVGKNTVIPAYGEFRVSVEDQVLVSPLGKAGEFYFENLRAGKWPAEVEFGDVSCRYELTIPESEQDYIRLGTTRCKVNEP